MRARSAAHIAWVKRAVLRPGLMGDVTRQGDAPSSSTRDRERRFSVNAVWRNACANRAEPRLPEEG